MFQTTSELSVKDNKSQAPPLNSQQFSLPLIPKKPVSRGELTSRKQIMPKQKLILPNINNNSQINIQSPQNTDRDKQNFHFLNKSAFAKDVKEKLNFVLGEMPHADNLEQDQDHQSNDSDFQAKINQNKEIIKQHRLKKDGADNIHLSQGAQKHSQQKKSKKGGLKARNQSLYQKRVKQYRDQSIQNKYLQKRKQTVKQKISNNPLNPNSVRQSLKDIKPRDEYGLGRMDRNDKNDIHKSASKKNHQRAISYKSSQKNLNQINKSVNLFDGIQNYLQNPRESKKQQPNQLVGLTLLKAKRDLEDKIKDLNQKLGTVDKQQEDTKKQPIGMNTTAKQWRRVEIKYQKIDCQNSNFDKQLQRISSLQQKNSLCLQKYLQHQKILLDLELKRKQLSRKLHVNSH